MRAQITVVIPTFRRESVLIESVMSILQCTVLPAEIIIVDQTPHHEEATERQLKEWEETSAVRWIRLDKPSIPHAMNCGLRNARFNVVLFLDDDIVASPQLVSAHASNYEDATIVAAVGQVVQPWQTPGPLPPVLPRSGLYADLKFPFHSTIGADVQNVMAGNLSVRRDSAISVGGFDENFCGAAYRFETEFARRLLRQGGRIVFSAGARIDHLRVNSGGTRQSGSHLNSADPIHGVGDYYFAMQHGWNGETWLYMARRVIREVSTRFHVMHPWYIPVKLVGEIRAWAWAYALYRRGASLLGSNGPLS